MESGELGAAANSLKPKMLMVAKQTPLGISSTPDHVDHFAKFRFA
jgi:hypothetical protein